MPGELFTAIADTPQTVPSPDDDVIATPPLQNGGAIIGDIDDDSKTNELRDNIILMLHPLSFTKCDESELVPATRYHTQSTITSSYAPIIAKSPASRKVPSSVEDDKTPKKRLKTTAAQVAYMEEWFKKVC